jgi:hypothetical protein
MTVGVENYGLNQLRAQATQCLQTMNCQNIRPESHCLQMSKINEKYLL